MTKLVRYRTFSVILAIVFFFTCIDSVGFSQGDTSGGTRSSSDKLEMIRKAKEEAKRRYEEAQDEALAAEEAENAADNGEKKKRQEEILEKAKLEAKRRYEEALKESEKKKEAEERERQKIEQEETAKARKEALAQEKIRKQMELEAKRKEEEEARSAAQERQRETERKRKEELIAKKKAEEEARLEKERARADERQKKEAELKAAKEAEKEAETKRRLEAKAKAIAEKQEEEARREKEKRSENIKAAEEEAKRRHGKELDAQDYIEYSRKYLNEGDYNYARGFALKAQAMAPSNVEIPKLMAEIDENEIHFDRQQRGINRENELPKTAREAKVDVYQENKGSRGWIQWIKDTMAQGKAETIGKLQTEKVYTIDDCVQLAIARSVRVPVADKQITLSEMRVWEAYRDLMPAVSIKMERSNGSIGADNMVRHYRGENTQVELKQVVFDGMEKWFAMRQAKTNLEIVKLEKEKIINEIVEETKKAYYNLDKTIKGEELQGEYKKKIRDQYTIVENAFKDELISRAEYLKAKAQSLQADFSYISAQEDRSLAEMILFQALNMEPEDRISIKPVVPPKETLSIGLQNCYDLALANEPEFRIKAKVIEYYNFERKMKKAKGWPKIEFNGSFGAAYENYQPLNITGDYFNPTDQSGPVRAGRKIEPQWYAGVKGSMPIFGNTFEYNYVKEKWAPTVSAFRGSQTATSYFTLKILDDLAYFSNLQEAKAGYDRANYEYIKAKQDLMVKVKEAYFKYRKSLIQRDVAAATLEHQKAYVAILQEHVRFGEAEITKMCEEQVKLAEEKFGMLQTDADYFISITELNKAIGLPEYFKPDYENTEYEEWLKLKKAAQEKEPIEAAEKVDIPEGMLSAAPEVAGETETRIELPEEVSKKTEKVSVETFDEMSAGDKAVKGMEEKFEEEPKETEEAIVKAGEDVYEEVSEEMASVEEATDRIEEGMSKE